MARTHLRTCNLCEAMCGIAITVEGETITSIRGDEDDPLSRGHICPKAVALADIHADPDRLRRPLRRVGERWTEIGWDEAFDEVATRLQAIQAEFGRDAVAVYQGNPTVHNHGSMMHGQTFVRALRTKNRYSATSLDQLPHMLASLEMFGHQLLLPVPDLDRTACFVIFGANPLASNGSLMSAPGIKRRLEAIQARGGRVIVVDPRRTETAELADEHIFIRPGGDALLLAALLNAILEHEPTPRWGRLGAFVDGLEHLRPALEGLTAEHTALATGVPAPVVRALARTLLDAPSAAVYGRVGVSTQAFGGLATWLINVINIVTGNLDRPGGMMFARPAIDVVELGARFGQKGHFGRRHSRVRGLPEFGGEYPTAVLAEEIETPGPGQIRGLVTSAGNPVLSAPNGRRLDAALARLDFMVSIDIYLNETTRHANIILPPTFALEHDHYDLAFHMLTVRNTAKYSPALFERPRDARHDWEIFLELTSRLGKQTRPARLAARARRSVLARLGTKPLLDLGLRLGPYKLSLRKLAEHPHGLDLGPLAPCLPERLYTKSKRIHLAPELYLRDLARLRAEAANAGGLVLIGRRELRSNNSWMHNSKRLVRGKPRCTLRMHPDDARRIGLPSDTAYVRIQSRAGEISAPLELSEEMMPGVVSLPHGYGHDRPGVRLEVASRTPGSSINDVTDEAFIDALTGNIAFSGVPVTIEAAPRNSPGN